MVDGTRLYCCGFCGAPEGTAHAEGCLFTHQPAMYPIRISTALFQELVGRDCHVEWGDPDKDGFYTPIVTARRAA